MDKARAFAPGNISCVFKIIYHEDPTKMHSLGMGFTVNEGVTVTAFTTNQTIVLFNNAKLHFPTVTAVVRKLTTTPIRIEIGSPLPLGCGFGLSGASALATAHAVKALLELNKSESELAIIAHVAEAENRTGLGDVCAQYHGGCLVKLREGYPLDAERLSVQEQPIFFKHFSSIRTKSILENLQQRARINSAADEALRELERLTKSDSVDFNACISLSKSFAVNSGLLSDAKVKRVIQQVEDRKGIASMIMLGNAVFSTQAFEGAKETILSKQRVKTL